MARKPLPVINLSEPKVVQVNPEVQEAQPVAAPEVKVALRVCGPYDITDPTDNNLKFRVGQVVLVHRISNYMQCQIAAKLAEVVEN